MRRGKFLGQINAYQGARYEKTNETGGSARRDRNPIYDTNGSPVYEIYNLAGGLCLTAQNLLAGMPLSLGTCNRATTTGQIWWELHGVGSPSGPLFQIFPWPVNFSYGNCVAASNLTSNNNTRLVMEPCDGSTGRVFRLG